MTTTALEPEAYLRLAVPGLAEDVWAATTTPLGGLVSHAHRQALFFATSQRRPDIAREAFTSETTLGDLCSWLSAAEPATDGRAPAGHYRSARVQLRPVAESDLGPLYEASLTPEAAHRWRFRGRTPSPDEFRQQVFSPAVLAQFSVTPTGAPHDLTGLVVAYDADLTAGHARVALQRATGAPPGSSGLLMEGYFIFVQYLFDHFDLGKLYLEVPEFNRSLIAGGTTDLIREEGRLRDHYFYGGRRWDLFLYALYRERWAEVAATFRRDWPEEHFRRVD